MTDLPFAGGADTTVGPVPGYYADPSIPGFVRYWGGSAWVPGTTRPNPAEGEVLEPPRFLNRPARPAAARYVPPPAGPEPGPGVGASAGAGAGAVEAGAAGAAETAAGPSSTAGTADGTGADPRPQGAAAGAGPGETGPVYLDQTMAGASFTMAPQAELELRRRTELEARMRESDRQQSAQWGAHPFGTGGVGRGGTVPGPSAAPGPGIPALRAAPGPAAALAPAPLPGPAPAAGSGSAAAPVPRPGAAVSLDGVQRPAPSGWQADPRVQRGLLETGNSPRHVSWGVLPGQSETVADRSARKAEPATLVSAGPAQESVEGREPAEGRHPVGAEPLVEAVPAARPLPGAAPGSDSTVVAAVADAVAVPVPAAARRPGAASEPVPAGVRADERAMNTAVAGSAAVGGPTGAEPAAGGTATRRAAGRRAPAAPVAGLGRRLLARVLDTVVTTVVAAAAGVPLASSAMAHIDEKLDRATRTSSLAGHQVQVWLVDGVVVGKAAALLAVLVLAGFLFEVLPTARTGQTFGKRVLGIRVVDAGAEAARGRRSSTSSSSRPSTSPSGRTAARTPAGASAGASQRPPARPKPPTLGRSLVRWTVRQLAVATVLGLLGPLLDRAARRGWHDRAARTRVVRA